jgi:hypothetical protein
MVGMLFDVAAGLGVNFYQQKNETTGYIFILGHLTKSVVNASVGRL